MKGFEVYFCLHKYNIFIDVVFIEIFLFCINTTITLVVCVHRIQCLHCFITYFNCGLNECFELKFQSKCTWIGIQSGPRYQMTQCCSLLTNFKWIRWKKNSNLNVAKGTFEVANNTLDKMYQIQLFYKVRTCSSLNTSCGYINVESSILYN